MAKLSAWLKKHLVSRADREKQSTDQPPFLVSPRRPITPTSCDIPTCLFFQLPYVIRSIIISMAFGGRILHVDIAHQEKAWQWRGCFCTRNDPRLLPSMRYNWLGPWNDGCIENMEYCERVWNTRPEASERGKKKYYIGIMGFLMSCRQAYTEGIGVLYSANCISMESETLLLNLPRLIVHNRLASITSLEIVVRAHCVKQENGQFSYILDHVKPILDNIVKHCHHLRTFSLSILVEQRHGHDLLDGPALPLVDAFWRSMQLRNMRVELPYRDYWALNTSEPNFDHPLQTSSEGPYKNSKWRSLDSEEPETQYRSIKRYPFPPLKLPVLDEKDESKESAGYWLCNIDFGPQPQTASCPG